MAAERAGMVDGYLFCPQCHECDRMQQVEATYARRAVLSVNDGVILLDEDEVDDIEERLNCIDCGAVFDYPEGATVLLK